MKVNVNLSVHMLQDCFQVFQLNFSICPLHATCLAHRIFHAFIAMIIDGVKILKLWRYFAASLYIRFQFYSHVRYEVLMVVPLKMKVFCDVRLCHRANSSCFFLYYLTLTIKTLWLQNFWNYSPNDATSHPKDSNQFIAKISPVISIMFFVLFKTGIRQDCFWTPLSLGYC